MLTLQALRRSRGLTLVDLALLSGVPARTLGAIECGAMRLDPGTRQQIAVACAVPPHLLGHPTPPLPLPRRTLDDLGRVAVPLATLLATTMLASALLPVPAPDTPALRPAAPAPLSEPVVGLARLGDVAAAALAPIAVPDELVTIEAVGRALGHSDGPPATLQAKLAPPPATADGMGAKRAAGVPQALGGGMWIAGLAEAPDGAPAACPLVPPAGRVVLTQGYGVGTHAPAETWGAIDLAVVGGATLGAPVAATHAGVAQVYPLSWPGGNFVRIVNAATGWSTAYGHLDSLLVADGQEVAAGTVVGTAGSTGYTTGPHLHYEVWRGGVNVDPTPFTPCG